MPSKFRHGIIQHDRDLFRTRNFFLLLRDAGSLLPGKRVDGDVLRPQFQHGIQRRPESGGRVSGESGNKIHIDGKAADPAHERQCGQNIRSGVFPADLLQHRIRHGLRIDADTGDPMRLQHRKLLFCDRVRPAGLHGEFPQM